MVGIHTIYCADGENGVILSEERPRTTYSAKNPLEFPRMRAPPVQRSRSTDATRSAVVLLALLAVSSGGTAQPPKTPSAFAVLTHNVYLIPGAPQREERARLLAKAEYLRGYDVLVLAELFDEKLAAPLLDSLAVDYPYRTAIVGSFLSREPDCASDDATCWNDTVVREGDRRRLTAPLSSLVANGGVAVLSRWPIVEKVQGIFIARCGEDALANKGFVYARLDRSGESVHVVGVHTQASPEWDEVVAALSAAGAPLARFLGVPACGGEDGSTAVRLAQLAQIRLFLKEKGIPGDEPLLIAGDLNVDRGRDEEYRAMLAILDVDEPVYDVSSNGATWDPATNGLARGEAAWLDYVLVGGGLDSWTQRALVVCPRDGGVGEYSDHYPVAAATAVEALPRDQESCR